MLDGGGNDGARVPRVRRVTPRPVEYLMALEEQGSQGYERLLARHDGSLALAAYELAAVKNEVIGFHACPNPRDIRVAARTIEGRVAWLGGLVPKAHVLAAECLAAGLPVLP